MRLVDEGIPLLHPSICILCEHGPADYTRTVDTLNDLEVPGLLNGLYADATLLF